MELFLMLIRFITVSDHTLVGHNISTASAIDEFECQIKCLGIDTCRSFNVHPGAEDTKRICELNNVTRWMKPWDFTSRKGSQYYGSVKVSRMSFRLYCGLLLSSCTRTWNLCQALCKDLET